MEHDQDLSVYFKVKTVDLVRPWMDMSLLNYETITLAGARKAQWSNGELVMSNTGSFTLLPTTVILAANVTISASSFSSESMEVIETSTSSPGGLVSNIDLSTYTSMNNCYASHGGQIQHSYHKSPQLRPPSFSLLALGKTGEGAYSWDFSGCYWAKRKTRQCKA